MTWLTLVLASLAVYRVARLATQEEGPWDIFARFRGWMGQSTWAGRGLHCIFCVSFWLAFVAAAMVVDPVLWREYVLASLGIAGGAVVIYQVVR